MAAKAVLSIQDMGAAGLTSSSVEMASKGGLGMEMDLDLVPVREDGMTAYEIMLSESQERMLMVIDPAQTETARAIFEKWDLDFMPIGAVTETGRLVLKKDGDIACDIPIDPLVDDAPEYDRPHHDIEPLPQLNLEDIATDKSVEMLVQELMGGADLASRRWIYEQYDHDVMADTFAASGGDAAMVRVHGTQKGLAISTDCTPRYVYADAFEGGKQAVAESYRNLCATGATPLAVTNNLNFGNPERPEIMAQIVGSVKGMGEACKALGTPVVSGNVSLYNETDGEAIFPCPVIGMVGTIADVKKSIGVALTSPGDSLYMIGKTETGGWLGASLLAEALGYENAYAPPPVSLEDEAKHGQFVAKAVNDGLIQAAHDISDGGLIVAVTEMALKGQKGADLNISDDLGTLFGEDQGRYVVAVSDAAAFEAAASHASVPVSKIGHVTNANDDGFGTLTVGQSATISMKEIFETNEALLPKIASA